jgi:hypothetical protein
MRTRQHLQRMGSGEDDIRGTARVHRLQKTIKVKLINSVLK